ncbi:MAG: hypothetical protein RB191_18940, partial [Terriglobia bacterium]|nr:hypothetical protein [Terriglobia bacterium]
RDYAMWATITVKHKMRPTSERNPGPHHTGISGPHPMESPAHIDRNTQARHARNAIGPSTTPRELGLLPTARKPADPQSNSGLVYRRGRGGATA